MTDFGVALPAICRTGVMLLAGFICLAANPAAAVEENPGPNANLLRSASGSYVYRTLSDGRARGTESFDLMVHRDGSRTMSIVEDLWARNVQFTVILRVADDFRPLTAFASYWVNAGYKGNATFQVDGRRLRADTVGPTGVLHDEIDVPERFSIGTHPVAGDGWHLWYVPTDEAGLTGMINLYSLDATPTLDTPVLGKMIEMDYEVVGDATIETPAGRFDTTHYRLLGATDVWVTGPDRILVRMVMEKFDREYVLAELETAEY